MESNEKKINIFTRIKKHYRKFMYKEETIKEMEDLDSKPFKERLKARFYNYFVVVGLLLVIIWVGVTEVINDQDRKQKLEDSKGTYITSDESKKIKREISSEDLTKYMIDKSDNSYIEIAQTKLDDKVAYSLTYKSNEELPKGKLTKSKRFKKGNITSILINGYPNVRIRRNGT